MLALRNQLYTCTFIAAAVLSACSAAPTDDTAPAGTGAATQSVALATLDLGHGHQIAFYDLGGGFAIGESFSLGQKPTWSVTDDIGETTLVGVYQHLAPAGSPVPEALVAADARYAALPKAEGTPGVPPPAVSGSGNGPALYTDAEQVWFQNTFCSNPYNVKCILGWDWAKWGYNWGVHYRTTGYVNTGGAASTLTLFRWDQATQRDVYVTSVVIGSNTVQQLVGVWTTGSYWRSELGNAGDFQVGLAIDTGFPIKGGTR